MKNMKKTIAIVLCIASIMTFMPMIFASAADTTVAAQDDLADLGTTLVEWAKLWGGLLKLFFGEDFFKNIGPALKDLFLGNLSIGDFFSSLGEIWKTISFGG